MALLVGPEPNLTSDAAAAPLKLDIAPLLSIADSPPDASSDGFTNNLARGRRGQGRRESGGGKQQRLKERVKALQVGVESLRL